MTNNFNIKGLFEAPPEAPRPGYDWSKPSRAIVAAGTAGGCVLYHVGAHIESMIDVEGVSDLRGLGLDDAPDGISVWEGTLKTVHHNTPDANEYDSWLSGTFRDPTPEEWERIQRNECPWNYEDWLMKAEGSK